MSDLELLELAAKVAGYEVLITGNNVWINGDYHSSKNTRPWNPLADDGDALRLVIKLKQLGLWSSAPLKQPIAGWEIDPYSATRRAIVEAAAQFGSTTTESR
jgi:hypothetical protein